MFRRPGRTMEAGRQNMNDEYAFRTNNVQWRTSMQKAGINWSVCCAVAFIWFTTQFGGGFASGRQIIDYFVSYGWYAVFTPVLAQALMAIIFYFVLKMAFQHRLRNYSEYTKKLYGRAGSVMCPLFELIFNMTLCVATAVAFATGGSTLTEVTGIPYIVSTLIIAVIMFVLTIFGYTLVQKAATFMSVFIVAGMLVVFVPNIIHLSDSFGANFTALEEQSKPLGTAMWVMFLYVAFQVPALGAYVAHVQSFSNEREIGWSMFIGFLVNSAMIMLTGIGMMAIYTVPGSLTDPLPILVMVKNGVGADILRPVISALIFLGALSTGVSFVYGIVNRLTDWVGRNDTPEVQVARARSRSMLFSLLYIVLTFSIAQFGLIPLVAKGYSYCGMGAIFIVIIPVLLRQFVFRVETSER